MNLNALADQAKPDTYKNFNELSQHEREGHDYAITKLDRSPAPVTVFAIHGGNIDMDTHLIAEALAGKDWSLYVFKGIKPKGNWQLHITSSHFDEPQALALAAKSERCLSIHGHKSKIAQICVGGADENLRAKMVEALSQSGLPFKTLNLCADLEGTDPLNIVNRCKSGGVQLEFSSQLRKTLLSNRTFFERTMAVIRKTILN